jgi:hypothetical protein
MSDEGPRDGFAAQTARIEASRRVWEANTSAFRDPSVPLTLEQLTLRKQVYKQISTDPETFFMNTWERLRSTGGACKTTRCVAGWAQFFVRGAVYEEGSEPLGIPPVDTDAIILLGLTEDEYDSIGCGYFDEGLFYLDEDAALERMRQLAQEE